MLRIEKLCLCCGKKFQVFPSGEHSKFCSIECSHQGLTISGNRTLKFKNIETQIELECTRIDFKNISKLNSNELNILINTKNKTIKNWTMWDYELNCYKSDIPRPKQIIKTVSCQYCDKVISILNYKRWHGNKCKLFSTLFENASLD